MSKLKLLSVALIATVIIAAPAMAHERHGASRHAAVDRYVEGDAYASTARSTHSCIPAPRVGAFATAPWTNEAPCEPGTGY